MKNILNIDFKITKFRKIIYLFFYCRK